MRSTETNDFPLLILFSIHCPLVKMRVNRDSRSPDSLVISCKIFHTGKSLSETLIFASTKGQFFLKGPMVSPKKQTNEFVFFS